MQDSEFDRRVREMMNEHLEMPGFNSWDRLQQALDDRKRAKGIYFRRITYASVAAAAALLLLLTIDKTTDITEDKNVSAPGPVAVFTPKPVIVEETAESKPAESKIAGTVSHDKLKPSLAENADTSSVLTDTTSITETTAEKGVKRDTKLVKKDETYTPYDFGEEPAVRKPISKRLLYALSTNLSPSLYNKSISMLSVSLGYQNDFVPMSLKETIQSQSVSHTRYAMPLSFGLQAQLPLNDRFAVGAGLCYSLLVSQYEKYSYDKRQDIQQKLYYIGVPVNIYYTLLQNNKMKVYVAAGIALDKGLNANYRIITDGVKAIENHSISGIQLSCSGGLGAEFKLSTDIGIYFDPSLAYYFKCDQPDNIRTAQQLQYKFELGVRFHL